MDRDQLLAESRKLPRHERARFVLDLVRDLESDEDSEVDADRSAEDSATHDAWTEELQRRWDEVRTGAVEPLTIEQFRQRVRELREARGR
jgi:putative addiction module component (TIGR02574 family)